MPSRLAELWRKLKAKLGITKEMSESDWADEERRVWAEYQLAMARYWWQRWEAPSGDGRLQMPDFSKWRKGAPWASRRR
ncbi:hypothetical protein LTR08_001053 [Meristemomyces frigidus]|nr:hypothetical protein LTR08_001053 [Meristemomyces frigidus]